MEGWFRGNMDIYKEELLDHFKNPRNKSRVKDEEKGEGKVLYTKDVNVSCGDEVEFFVRVKKEGENWVVEEVGWDGSSCVISSAVASKLSEWLKGKRVNELRKMDEKRLVEEALGWEVSPGRKGCLFLPVRVVKDLVKQV